MHLYLYLYQRCADHEILSPCHIYNNFRWSAHSGFYENALYKFTFTYLLTYLLGRLLICTVLRTAKTGRSCRTVLHITSAYNLLWHSSHAHQVRRYLFYLVSELLLQRCYLDSETEQLLVVVSNDLGQDTLALSGRHVDVVTVQILNTTPQPLSLQADARNHAPF